MSRKLKIVAVGASAGGLSALIEFFKGVPAGCESAFLVIQHLSPDHASMMDELLAPHVKLPIEQAENGGMLSPGIIYLCPPGVIPELDGMELRLHARPKSRALSLPINVIFSSMARTLGSASAVVVLSGTGSDGSEGVVLVSKSGGLVAVQKPDTAEFNGMPQNAISTGCADIVAAPKEIWAQLDRFAHNQAIDASYRPIAIDELTQDNEQQLFDEKTYRSLFELLDERFGLNFSLYRINSVSRRLKRRMDLLGIGEISQYREYLDSNEAEVQGLYQDLLIGETQFFRDSSSFELMSREGIKARMAQSMDSDFRLWVAGCATGQEAYTMFILADEARQELGFRRRITIFATDTFKPSIEFAGRGVYTADQLLHVDEKRRQVYFKEIDASIFKIKPFVRESIIFAQHNFLVDAPFTKIDVVSCRNVLIYMKPQTQRTALEAFTYALKEGGTLFLGPSEGLGELESNYKIISSRSKLFRKYGGSIDPKRWSWSSNRVSKGYEAPRSVAGSSVTINRQLLTAYDALLERFEISGFLINAAREVLHYFGDVSDFCIHVNRRVRLDVTDQLDKPLKLAVTALIHRCSREKVRAHSRGIRCQSRSGRERIVDIAIELLNANSDKAAASYLIEIYPRSEVGAVVHNDEQVPADDSAPDAQLKMDFAQQIETLEQELRSTKENLETSNEELQASNEELQAINEEMQVSNEELQSTNEELYSLNEELTTLNTEYERKNEQLIEINDSHENLLESTEDGILYVDLDLRIKKFNTAICNAFQLVQSDIDRPLDHIAYRLEGAVPIEQEVRRVMETGEAIVIPSNTAGERNFLKRIFPFRGADGEVIGALLSFTDISEQIFQEARFKFALKTARTVCWDYDVSKGSLTVQSVGDCILGSDSLSEGETTRDYWVSQVHPDDREMVERSLDACLQGETEQWHCEHRFRGASGAWVWVKDEGMVLRRSADGQPIEMIGTTQDINDYKLALQDVINQRDVLRVAGDIASLGYWEYDPATHTVEWSSQTRNILGVSEDYDPSVEGFYAFVDPEDRERIARAFEETVASGAPYDLELKCTDKKGRRILAQTSARAGMDAQGKVVRVVGVFQDVTDVLTTKHEMSAFFSSSPDFHATVAYDGGFKSFNGAWLKQLGYSEERLRELSLSDVVAAESREKFKEEFGAVIGGASVTGFETRVLALNEGNPGASIDDVWLSWSLSCDPQLGCVFISARNVTAQKQALQDLRAARIRAESANRAKADFLAVMSHEMRTPLNPILGYARMLVDEMEDEEHKGILHTIAQSGDHMVHLIDDILDFSKIDAGKMKVEPVYFSLSSLVSDKARLMRGMIKGDSPRLNDSIDWGVLDAKSPPMVKGDLGMIRQILRNLISNAIKFTDEGEVNLNARVLSASEGRARVQFSITDSGIGIAQEDLDQLFEPFSQVDGGMTRRYGGTGLGLAICYRLVGLLDGTLTVESKVGKGSVFTATLPLDYETVQSDGSNSVPAKSVSAPASKHQNDRFQGRVLVVEDNHSNALFVRKMVELNGLEVVVVGNGEDALERISQEEFQLVLLDLHMPGIGGLEALKRLRQREQEAGLKPLVVVVLTADASVKARRSSMEAGANGFLTKPVLPPSIKEVFEKYLVRA